MSAPSAEPQAPGHEAVSPMWLLNVRKMWIWQSLVHFSLWLPFWVAFLQKDRGFTVTEVGLLLTISWMVTTIAEVPTGIFADTYSRKTSIVLGTLLVAVAYALFAWSPTRFVPFLAIIIWQIGLGFENGADLALIYDSLKSAGQEEEYPKVSGRFFAILQASQSVAALAGAAVVRFGLAWPFVVSVPIMVVAATVAITLREPPLTRRTAKPSFRTTTTAAYTVLQQNRPILFQLLFYAGIAAVMFIVTFTLFQPYALAGGVSVSLLGPIFFAVRGTHFLGSWSAHRVIAVLGERRLLALGWLVIAVALAGAAVVAAIPGLILLGLVGLANAVLRPALSNIINRQLPSDVRASVLSFGLLLYGAILTSQVLIGAISDRYGIGYALLAIDLAFIALIGPLLAFFLRWLSAPAQTAAANAPLASG